MRGSPLPERVVPQDLEIPTPTNLTPILGPQRPQGQEHRHSGASSSSLLPGSLVPGQPSVIPSIQSRPDDLSGQGDCNPEDGLASQGLYRAQGDPGFASQNVKPELYNSGPSLQPTNGPQIAQASGQAGTDFSVQAELQGLTDQEAIQVLSAHVISLGTELARRGRDNIGPGASTPIHPDVQRELDDFELEPATPKFGEVPEQTEPHVFL